MRDIGNPLSGMRESEEIMLKAGMLGVGHTNGSLFSCRALRLAEQVVSVCVLCVLCQEMYDNETSN